MSESTPAAAEHRPGDRVPDAEVPRLAAMPWPEVHDWLHRDPRLILPVGCFVQHGPHLPLYTDTLIVTAVAEGIAARHEVLVAPTLPFGAAPEGDRAYAGTAALRPKTLHRVLNELVSCWEAHGVTEFVLVTSQGWAPHFGSLLTVITEAARVRAVDLNAVNLSPVLGGRGAPERAGEVETSLVLHLAPGLVRRDAVRDALVSAEELDELLEGTEPMPPPGSPGVVGTPTAASAEKGREIYAYLVEHIGTRLFDERADDAA